MGRVKTWERTFNWGNLSSEDAILAKQLIGEFRQPDLVIAPNGKPYLYRWYVTPRLEKVNTYLHVQVADDPERPLHDHPWDNFSVILRGGYTEILAKLENGERPLHSNTRTYSRYEHHTIWRQAEWAHRLILPAGFSYTMTQFSTGPKRREWGFWYPNGWRPYTAVTRMEGNTSIHVPASDAMRAAE